MIIRRFMKDVVWPVAVAIALAILIQGIIAKPYQIPTPSMDPTIAPGDRVIANRLIYKFRDPKRGDIIVFQPTDSARQKCDAPDPEVPFVKRVIGLPGDHVEVIAGKPDVLINGKPYVAPRADINPLQGESESLPSRSFDVPPDSLFVLGDNRQFSCDSHQWPEPFVPLDRVIGQAEVTYWPLSHVKFLS